MSRVGIAALAVGAFGAGLSVGVGLVVPDPQPWPYYTGVVLMVAGGGGWIHALYREPA